VTFALLYPLKGSLWLVGIYAILVVLFSNPVAPLQGEIVYAMLPFVIAFIFLLFPMIMGEVNLPLSLFIFSLSVYSFFTWTKFDFEIFSVSWFYNLNEKKLVLIMAMVIFFASILVIIADISEIRSKPERKRELNIIPFFLVFFPAVIIGVDRYLPGLIW